MTAHLSESEYAALVPGSRVSKRSKYGAVPVVVTADGQMYEAKAAKAEGVTGQRFASTAEARHYLELLMLVRAGQISELECQPKFEIHGVDGSKIGAYLADFKYYDRSAKRSVVIDVKGGKATRTAVYRLKRKLVCAEYGVEIREIG